MTQLAEPTHATGQTELKLGVIDTDVHTSTFPTHPDLVKHLSKRWVDHLDLVGLRMMAYGGERPRQRMFAHRTDSVPPGGGFPGSDPDFVRAQLLDRFDLSGAVMNDIVGFYGSGARNHPRELSIALSRAYNDYRAETWLASDPRWYGSINVPFEVPEEAAKEIVRCREETGEYRNRWVQVLLTPDNIHPAGNPFYWPIFEACEHYGIPVAYHVLAQRRITAAGNANYYFEEHCDFAQYNFPLVSSLVFEGVFERFPRLKVALIELAWSWAPAFGWRMDAAHRKLASEVPHLERKPSEYFRDHFWLSSQPMEEPEQREWIEDVYATFEQAVGDRLMYSSDYPHWDFDAPDALWDTLPLEARRKILGGNASALYGIDLLPGRGMTPEEAGARVY